MTDIIHVTPVNDTYSHEQSADCACDPSIEEDVVVHNSYDGRELIEEANRIMNETP